MVLRIFSVIATSGFVTALECTKIRFRQGAPPLTPLGELAALLPTLYSWFKRPYF